MNKTVYHSLCILSIIIMICIVSYDRIIEGFEETPSLDLAKTYIDAAVANRRAITSTNINISSAKTDIDGISNAISNTITRITTSISLIVTRVGTVIANSSNTNIKKLLLKNVFMVAKISRDVTATANSVLNTLSNMISIPIADRELVSVEWNGAINSIKNAVISIQKIASVIIDISPKLSILGVENTNSDIIQQLAATQEQTNSDAETAQLGFLAVKAKIAEVKKAAADREAASKVAIETAEAAQNTAASRINTADYLSYATKALELAQAVINNPNVSEANKVIWRTKVAEQKTFVDTENARIAAAAAAAKAAAEKEAARIAAEREAARLAAERAVAEKEAARIAAEREAARAAQIEADKKAAVEAALAAQIAQQQDADKIARDEAYRQAAKNAADELAAAKAASAKLAILFSNVAATNAAQAAEIAERAEAEAARAAAAKAAAEAEVQRAAAAKAAAEAAAKKAADEASAAAGSVASAQKLLNSLSIVPRSAAPVRASRAPVMSSAIILNETPEEKAVREEAARAAAAAAAEAAAEASRKAAAEAAALEKRKKDAKTALDEAKAEAAATAARIAESQQAAQAEINNAKAAAERAEAAEQAAIQAKAAAARAEAAKKAATNAILNAAQIAEDAWKGAARYGCRNLITSSTAFDNMTCNDNEYINGFQKVNNAYHYTCCNVPKGINGSGGLPGFQGPIGPIGVTGAQGQKGLQGSQGSRGLQGEQGEKGFAGVQGISGIQGQKGAIGIQGEMGNPITVDRGIIVRQVAGPPGRKGEAGPRGPSGLQGQQGPVGTKGWNGMNGMNGLPGDRGDTGERGERGPDGKKGPRGKMAEIVEPPSVTSYLKKGFNYVQNRIKNFIVSKQNTSTMPVM